VRLLRRFALGAATLISAAAALGVLGYCALLAGGLKPVVVYSGSMEPALPIGSLVALRETPAARVAAGDVITFDDPYEHGHLVTHRVVSVFETPRGRVYRTKGDANAAVDPWQITLPGNVGTPSLVIPYAGYVLLYAERPAVRQLVIVAFAGLLLLSLLRRIWRRAPDLAAEEQKA
jgi:signal peptidase